MDVFPYSLWTCCFTTKITKNSFQVISSNGHNQCLIPSKSPASSSSRPRISHGISFWERAGGGGETLQHLFFDIHLNPQTDILTVRNQPMRQKFLPIFIYNYTVSHQFFNIFFSHFISGIYTVTCACCTCSAHLESAVVLKGP